MKMVSIHSNHPRQGNKLMAKCRSTKRGKGKTFFSLEEGFPWFFLKQNASNNDLGFAITGQLIYCILSCLGCKQHKLHIFLGGCHRLLAPQSGALRISAYRDFLPIPSIPSIPLIAFEHSSLSTLI